MNVIEMEEPIDLGNPDSWPKGKVGFKDVLNAIKNRLFPEESWKTPIEDKIEEELQPDLS